jgi:general secretion pathway protein N
MRWAWILGLGVFPVAAIVLAPATLIDARLEQASHGRLRVAEAQGSVWSGAGWIEAREAQGGAGVARRVAWQVLPWPLLRGQLVAEVGIDAAAKPFVMTMTLAGIDIADFRASVPASVLGLAMPRLAPLRLSGDVLLDIPRLSFRQRGMSGDAMLEWRSAGSALTPVSPLGEYEVRFRAEGAGVHAELRTLKGPVRLAGDGTWSKGRTPSYVVTARVPAQERERLSPLFRLIAVQRGEGIFELSSNKTALLH